MKEIIDDLEKRELTVAGFIVNDSDGNFMYISYDNKGLVNFISEKAKNISINERLEGRMIRPMVDLSVSKEK